jgi:hypothetical protein
VARDSGVGRLVRSSTACGKRQRSGETFTFCSSVIVKCGDKNENICKNRLYLFEIDDTWDDIFNDLLEESEFKIHKTDTVSVIISDKLMILGMIYSMIYWRKVSLKSIKQTQYQ